ncbi:MarR family transcriptional regulator [Planotetraspora phitsanulokensis]|uniref:MarR family transcriptional regulator n=1 Tax=Planotetraspora phitsanulokensis TaxID=575192 RepID=A0A8J3U0X5_9ACTN|nr:MarR family winged helix-turn-helix transcriptional regulator [Planotetraspora phitsanulokensis]GII35867.1 MarR family transcriptional regulator [Planotetraspora phitsanulokensis]
MDLPAARPPSLLGLSTYLLSQTGKTARARLAQRLADRGLKLWHMATLAALADFGPHVQRELAARLAMDPSDVAKVVDELAAAGYVDRSRDPGDRRRVAVTLTGAGRATLAELDTEARQVQDDILAPLSLAERAQIHVLLEKVYGGLRRTSDPA